MNFASLNKDQRRVSTALCSIARRHQHNTRKKQTSTATAKNSKPRARRPTTGSKNYGYVPEAYRGAKPDAATDENNRFKLNHRPKRRGNSRITPKFGGLSPASIAYKEKKEKMELTKEKEGRLLGLQQEFVRLASEYKQVLSSDRVAEMENLSDRNLEDWKEEKEVQMETWKYHLRTVFDDLHQADKPTEWAQIEQSDDLFRSLCRLTRSMIMAGTELYKDSDQTTPRHIRLAESALQDLVKFQSERALLVNATKKGIAQASLRSPESIDEVETSSSTFGVPRWIQNFMGAFSGTTTEKSSEEKVKPEGPVFDDAGMGHRDPNLGATQLLFKLVIKSIASAVEKDADVPDDDLSRSERQQLCAATAMQMLNVMEAMPPTWVPEPEIGDQILALLSRGGTLESAQKCHRIYLKHPSSKKLQFSRVLEAFVEAAKNEKNAESRKVIVTQAIAALNARYSDDVDTSNRAERISRVERINLCSIILHCMSVTDITSSPKMCEDAEKLVKGALGTARYHALRGRISSQGKVDSQSLHLVHFLVQIYASSGDQLRLEGAQRMLEWMKATNTEVFGQFFVFPNGDTFNSVLKGLLRRREAKRLEPMDEESAWKDVTYAMGLLNHMLTSKEISCWPNEDTFALLFKLLLVSKIWDGGDRAEELLSKFEIRRSFPGSHDVKINLSAYNHTLGCWLEVAKSSSGKGVCERALRLLNKLEVQSMPLLSSHLEARLVAGQFPVYDIGLQPNRNTYNLILQICAEVKDPVERKQAVILAADVQQRMADRGIKHIERDELDFD
jgi:hypothetical protein